ncbi:MULTISPECIES: aminotransferase class III-fold pyridoxal phosphate-dependent enzyme [unclassified Caulobacter]|uniref:aminotransferase class III-fold pyridoxal phosphate-dependent enzyme n=1 Tax=unclassified Caulobacter TaxID=2648921 RepID=UPI0006F4155C|nr:MULTISPECIES: aminotransferase class III-fold pyridoxal phosphate-dependent enzyme [unclassified Caulobacter]KQV57824.1 glutamate-1-semialdehyde 2,1-aminomutase [Caulobacter sp. Root342]KQV67396.1 glutamate-1-semialdehyde 2,1-aminomutase [Caulobacter sp. Root343]
MTWTNSKDTALRERAMAVIPNGMYGHQSVMLLPDDYPQFFDRAQGAYLWDVDGNRYIDFMCGYGPNLFGYGHAAIDQAYVERMKQGDTMTGPGQAMVELAEALTTQVSHADWAMFCKNGTDATTMAMMIARNFTQKKTIVLAKGAYHGAAPWCTPLKNGTTPADRANQVFYTYNDVESLEAAVREAGSDLAAIFAAPIKHDAFIDQELPDPEYARRARQLCDEHGALLIVDDVRAGFRLARDCSWSLVGVKPDMSTWGKAIANGHPISALLGADVARFAAATIYATGSFWFSAAPMAASLATLKLIRETDYLERTIALGERLRTGLDEVAGRHGVGLRQTGPAQLPLIMVDDDPTGAKGYFWNNALLKRGVYFHPWHNMFITTAMTDGDIDHAVEAADDAFKLLKAAGPLEPVAKLEFMHSLVD